MSLRDVVERIRSNPVPLNEEAAKFQILAPILDELAWDPFGTEIRWEHPVGGKKSGGKVDIALEAGSRILALIEAKSPGSNLDQHIEQVLSYAFFEGVAICALSDGLQWWLYLPLEQGPHEERRFAVVHLMDDPIDQVIDDLGMFLGRDSLMAGQAVTRAKEVRNARLEAAHLEKEMPKIWQQMVAEPDDELVELVGQRVYDRLRLRPAPDQVVAAMRNQPVPTRAAEAAKPRGSASPKQRTTQKRAPRPVAVLLWGERHPVRTHAEILMTVVEELCRRHPDDFDRSVEPLRSRKSQYVSRDSGRVRATRIKQTPSGHYVDINLSAQSIKERVIRLLEALGHRESDLEYIYN
jgi:hypothetical protein